MKWRKERGIFRLACVCLALSSLVLLLIPWVDFYGTPRQRALGIAMGLLFWTGLLAGWILYGSLYRRLKAKGELPEKTRPGLFRFFSCRKAAGVDLAWFAALALNVVFLLRPTPWPWAEAPAAFAFLLCFHGHYLFNGATYQRIFLGERRSL